MLRLIVIASLIAAAMATAESNPKVQFFFTIAYVLQYLQS